MKKLRLIIILLLVVFTFSRFINLEADRPVHIFATVIDEGYKAQGAKYQVLFDTWVDDDSHSNLVIVPLYTYVLAQVYKLLGVSLFSTRILSAFAGAISVLLLYLTLRKENKNMISFHLCLGSISAGSVRCSRF